MDFSRAAFFIVVGIVYFRLWDYYGWPSTETVETVLIDVDDIIIYVNAISRVIWVWVVWPTGSGVARYPTAWPGTSLRRLAPTEAGEASQAKPVVAARGGLRQCCPESA